MNRSFLPFFLALLLLLGLATPSPAAPRDIRHINHYSEALGRHKVYGIYLPSNRRPDETFSTLFILHGAYGSFGDWLLLTDVQNLADAYRMILVFPDGDPFGWYVDSTQEEGSAMATYVARELVAEVDSLFPTTATAESRGIMGLSMGGHGALLLAAQFPDVFTSASSLSGILDITNHAEKWEIAKRLGPLEENRETWEAHSVHHNAERFRDFPHPILFDCGVDDTAIGATQDNRAFHARLKELGIPHIYRELPGGHTWEYWGAHLQSHLNFHMGNLVDGSSGLTGMHAHYFRRLARFHRENAEATITPRERPVALMVGASSTEGFPEQFLPGYTVVNRGISSDTIGLGHRGVSHRFHVSIFDVPADVIIFKNGRNDLGDLHRRGWPAVTDIIAHYQLVIRATQRVHPDARILVVSSFPTSGRYAHLAGTINIYNEALRRMAKSNYCTWVDAWSEMVDKETNLLLDEYSADGLHLNTEGRRLWGELMIAALAEPAPVRPLPLEVPEEDDEAPQSEEVPEEERSPVVEPEEALPAGKVD